MSSIKLITSQLLNTCIQHMENAESIYLLISFTMESGVRLLTPFLRDAAERGADVKILTGDYLYVTQPDALAALGQIHPTIAVRLWNSRGTAFHPKAYLFRKSDADDVLIVGSSNISQSALTTGVEWNLSLAAANHREIAIDEAEDLFLNMFYAEQTVPVNPISIVQYRQIYEAYHRQNPNFIREWTDAEALSTIFETESDGRHSTALGPATAYMVQISPRPAQIEALHQLNVTRSEGYNKALVVMATGLGKTFLAALFAQAYRRVLFVAHREEILLQAQRAFQTVSPDKSTGLFTGRQKDGEADIVFASILTLGSKRHRTRFHRNDFDLIIIDEFHHAAAATYHDVMDWFQPAFQLGITATPDRADGREIYALCDGNVAYRVDFLEAIVRGWLAPFHYIGIYDETDYNQIRWLGSKYDEHELLAAQTKDSMARVVLDAWTKYAQSRGIAFCSSVAQALFLAQYFQTRGVRCVCLHGGSAPSLRAKTIQQLTDGELHLLFTVDLFNEGVDIPAVDTLLFVRPTESLTIFTQQLGRGLRHHPGKTHCTIVDVIGNYRNADLKLSLFNIAESIENVEHVGKSLTRRIPVMPRVPQGCSVDLDLQVIDLLEVMRLKKQPRKDHLRAGYSRLTFELGRRPSYLEFHLLGGMDSRGIKQEFGSFVHFLAAMDELDEIELDAFLAYGKWFRELEGTAMTKGYKMVMLLAMLERGEHNWFKPAPAIEIAAFFHHYYMDAAYRRKIDFSDKRTTDLAEYNPTKIARLITQMPMSKWSGSSRGLAKFEGASFWFDLDVQQKTARHLFEWTKEICLYRLHAYFERKASRSRD